MSSEDEEMEFQEDAADDDDHVEDENEEEESEDDVPLASFASPASSRSGGKRRRGAASVNYADDGSSSSEEDDDDVPLASLKSPVKKKAATAPKKKVTKKKATPAKKKAKSSSSSSSTTTSNTEYRSPSAALYGSGCAKGRLIQGLLCRWWYAMEWPNPNDIPKTPPANYDPLDGMPGVFVCTSGDDVGSIQDFRKRDGENSSCPSYAHLSTKSSQELQTLVIQALQEQKKQLIAVDGSGTVTEKKLNEELKWAQKVKAATADKEALKVLKAVKFKG